MKKLKAKQYAEEVLEGKIACNWIKKACKRFLSDLEREDLEWNQSEVDRVTSFFEDVLYVPELKKSVPLPLPHAFWIEQLYGFYYKDGPRRFQDLLLLVARKNFKTYYAAAISLYELILGKDVMPQVLQGANSRDQALICTDMAGKLAKFSPDLNGLIKSQELRLFNYKEQTNKLTFEDSEKKGWIEAIPKDLGDGGNPSCSVIDEFHEASSSKLLETIKSGQGQRLEPLNLVISSPGHDKAGPLYSTLRKRGIDCLNGITDDDRNLVIIFEQDKPEDWDKHECIEKANPMVKYSPTLANNVKERIKEAKIEGGFKEVSVKIKNCGVWTDASTVWIPADIISKNNKPDSGLQGMDVYAAFDLSKGKDLSCMGLLFPVSGEFIFKAFYWIPEDKILNNEDHVDYRQFQERGGNLFVHDGNVLDHDLIAAFAIEELKNYNVKGISFDAKYAYQGVITSIAKAGYEDILKPIGQGFNLSPAVTEVEVLCSQFKFNFLNNPITEWCFSNVEMKVGEMGHRYPSKARSRAKIDGISTLLTAFTDYNGQQAEEEKESGVLWI